jgi:hypothetical protein
MFKQFGTPERLSSIGQETIDIKEAKSKIEIAVLDDKPFAPKESLVTHNFRIKELGPDIRSTDMIAPYPIIICDVRGVGRAFGSPLEGAHLVSEIRKDYPDKYIVSYTGETYSLPITNALAAADKRLAKDDSIDVWIKTLETGLNEVSNPRNRWIRLRTALLSRGVELYEVFNLEQALIKAVLKRQPDILKSKATTTEISSEAKDLVIKFSATALATLIGSALGI